MLGRAQEWRSNAYCDEEEEEEEEEKACRLPPGH